MPAIVARSVIASRNSDPPSEYLTNTALVRICHSQALRVTVIQYFSFSLTTVTETMSLC